MRGASSSGSPPGRAAANDLSSSSRSALISAMFLPPSSELSASGRSLVPWQTEQVADDQEAPHLGPGALVVAALRPLDGGDGVLVGHVEVDDPLRPPRGKGDPPLDLLAVQHDVALARGELAVRDAGPHPEFRRGVAVEPPGAQVPRQDRAVVNALVRVGDEGAGVNLGPHPQAVAGGARAVGVEREGLGARRLEVRTAHGAHDLHLAASRPTAGRGGRSGTGARPAATSSGAGC